MTRERRGCPNCAKALALINKHLSGRVYDDLDDALRNLLQAFITMRDLEFQRASEVSSGELICEFVGCEECAARKRMLKR